MSLFRRAKKRTAAMIIAAALAAGISGYSRPAEGFTKPTYAAMQDLSETSKKISKSSLSADSANLMLRTKVVALFKSVEKDFNDLTANLDSATVADVEHVLDGVKLMIQVNNSWETATARDKFKRKSQAKKLKKMDEASQQILAQKRIVRKKHPEVKAHGGSTAPGFDEDAELPAGREWGEEYQVKMPVQKIEMKNTGMIKNFVIIQLRNQIAKDLNKKRKKGQTKIAPEMVQVQGNKVAFSRKAWDAAKKGDPVMVSAEYILLPPGE